MNDNVTSSIPDRLRSLIWALVAVLLLFLLLTLTVGAQTIDTAGRWRRFHIVLGSQFDRGDLAGSVNFLDTANGSYSGPVIIGDTSRNYTTTDAGLSWTPSPWTTRVDVKLAGDVAVSYPTSITRDGGRSWRAITFPNHDSSRFYAALFSAATPPSTIVVLCRAFDTTGPTVDPCGPVRLAFSIDAGRTWTFADSTWFDGGTSCRNERFTDSTWFGPFPEPEAGESVVWNRWAVQLLKVYAGGEIVVANNYRPYRIGRLSLQDRSAVWYDQPPGTVTPTFVARNEAYTSALLAPTRWMRSTDGGRTWDSVAIPSWVDSVNIRFIGPGFGMSRTGRTTDGGRTWRRWRNPYGRMPVVIDSSHFAFAGRYSFFAYTSDGGRTWRQSGGGGQIEAIVAHGGRVIAGRPYRGLIVSVDSGETWRDLGREGKLPEEFTSVRALSVIDTTGGRLRVLAVCTFMDPEGEGYVGTMESVDGGESWTMGEKLAPLADHGTVVTGERVPVAAAAAARNATGDLRAFVSFDGMIFVRPRDGGAWERGAATLEASAFAMRTADSGAAQTSDGKIAVTTDGGATWRIPVWFERAHGSLGLTLLSGGRSCRAFYNYPHPDSAHWFVVKSDDGGRMWRRERHQGDTTAFGSSMWRDTTRLYVIGTNGVIRYSRDGGTTFVSMTGRIDWFETDSYEFYDYNDGYHAYLPAAPRIASDDRWIYVVGRDARLGRFRMVEDSPTSGIDLTDADTGEKMLRLHSLVGTAAELELRLSSWTPVEITVADLLGTVLQRRLEEREAGVHRATLDLGELPSGRYTVTARVGRRLESVPVVVVR